MSTSAGNRSVGRNCCWPGTTTEAMCLSSLSSVASITTECVLLRSTEWRSGSSAMQAFVEGGGWHSHVLLNHARLSASRHSYSSHIQIPGDDPIEVSKGEWRTRHAQAAPRLALPSDTGAVGCTYTNPGAEDPRIGHGVTGRTSTPYAGRAKRAGKDEQRTLVPSTFLPTWVGEAGRKAEVPRYCWPRSCSVSAEVRGRQTTVTSTACDEHLGAPSLPQMALIGFPS